MHYAIKRQHLTVRDKFNTYHINECKEL